MFNNSSENSEDKWILKPEKFSIKIHLSDIQICSEIRNENENLDEENNRKVSNESQGRLSDFGFVFVWDSYVFKMNEKVQHLSMDFYISPKDCYEKLKKSPIMIKLSDHSVNDAITQIRFSECFCNSVQFQEFSSQTIHEELVFIKNENQISGRCMMEFNIKKDQEVQSFNLNLLKSEPSDTSLDDGQTDEPNMLDDDEHFCDKLKITYDLPLNCRNLLEDFHKMKF